MFAGNTCVKSAWIAVEVTRERAEKVLVVEAYIAVSSLEPNFDPARYDRLIADVRCVLGRNPDIDRASILSMHRGAGCASLSMQRDKACTGLFRRMAGDADAGRPSAPARALHA